MKYSNTVEYNIKTSLDSKGLTQLKSELQGLELKLQNMGNKGLLDEKTFVDARNQIQGLGQALTDAFNPSLGMLDLSKLNQELKNNDVTAQGLKTAFSSLGAEGQVAFNNLVGELGKLDTGILRTNSQVDKLFTTFSNTFRWGLVSSFFSQFMNAIHSSVSYVKELDDSLTQIMLVTDYNRDSMNQFAKSANEAAKAVSMTTTGMTNASLIFAQQGYDLGQSQELATLSAKLANASQQDTATTSDQITAYMNAYGLENSIAELTQQMDNWALIANVSAADVGELAQASQRAASMANAVGVSGEQLAAQIATIESVTREAPEQIGNGLKTLYARFSDIAAGGEDEDGFGLGKVTSELNAIGVQIFDQMGQIRDVGDIMEDLMVIWDDLDQTSKVAASQALAGKYQVNRFMALMDNSDMYQEYKGATGSAATGTLDQMNEEYANSIEGRSAKLQASLEGLFSTIFNTDDIYPWMDAAQGAVDLLQQFFDALGGGKTVLLGISSLLMQVFSKNMAQEINNAATNRAIQQQKLENLQNSQAALTTLGAANPNPNDANSQNILNFAQYMQANAKNFNAEQMDQANSILQELVQNSNAATMAADKLKDSLSIIGTGITATTGESILAPFLDSEGAVNATLLSEALQNMSQSEVADMFSHIQEDIKDAREGLLEFNKALQDYQQELRNVDSTDDTWNQSLDNLKATLLNLKDYIDPSTYERYEQAVHEISQVTENAGDKTAETTAEVAKLADGLEKIAAKDLTNLDQLNKDAFQAKNTQMAAADSNKVAGAFQEGMGSQAQIQEVLNTLNAVQQLTFAWQAFQNLGSLWANEDLSTGEKVLQTIMNLTMAMPQLITAMQTLQDNSFLSSIGNNFMNMLSPNGMINIGDLEKHLITLHQIQESGERSGEMLSELSQKAQQADEILLQIKLLPDDIKKSPEELQKLSEAWDSALEEGLRAKESLKEMGDALAENANQGAEATKAIGIFSKSAVGAMAEASAAGASSLGVLAAGFKVVAAEAWAFITGPAAPFIIAGAAIAAIAAAIGAAQEQAKEAHDQAIADFEEAKNIQQQVLDLSAKIDNWKSKKQSGENNEELINEAKELADEFRALGKETEATNIALAAARAEAQDTAEGYNALEEALTNTQKAVKEDSYLDAMNKAQEVLENQLSTIEEINAAKELMMDSGGQLGMQKLADTEGQKMHVFDAQDEVTGRAGTEALTEATASWKSIDLYLKEVAPGYSEIADEAERLAKAQQWATTEAQKAVITTRELLLANQNLTERGGAYDSRNDYVTAGREGILDQLRNAGFTAEEQLKIVASFDDDATDKEITEGIAKIQEQLKTNPDLTLAIRAALDEDNIKQSVEKQLENYQPKDADVTQEDFQRLTNTFYENKDKMGEEGTPFEDLSETLFTNAEALERLVEGILRYNDAIASIDENYDKWNEALEDNNIFSDEYQDTLDDLQDTYADFLDLSENLSDEFLSNRKNLQKLKDASEGVEGAYEDLEDAAKADIYMNVTGIDNIDVAEEKIKEISNLLSDPEFEAIDVGEAFDISSFPDLEASINNFLLNFKGSAEEAVAAVHDLYGVDIPVNNIVEAGNDAVNAVDSIQNTSQDTVSVVGEMAQGVTDAARTAATGLAEGLTGSTEVQVDGETAVANDTVQYTNLTPQPGPEQTITSYMPVGNGNTGVGSGVTMQPFVAHVRGVTYKAESIPVPETKEMTGQQIKTEYKPGSTDGGFTLKPGAMGTKAAPSSTKRSGGARPSSSGGGGGGGKSCFVAGTLIFTSLGFKPIEQIRKEDIVLSYNKSIGLNEYSKVLQTMIHDTTEPIYTLYIKNEQLRVTGIHRFFITNKITSGIPQWVHAADLKVGQWVLFADGTWHVIHKIEVNIEHQTVYNFEVSHNHNYYVGRNQILAHNKGGSGGKGSSGKAQEPKKIEPKEKKEHEKDYYEEVDNQISKIEKTLSKIEKQEDRLVGTKARANQNRQINILKEEIKLQEKKLDILKNQEQVDVWKALKDKDKEAQDLLRSNGIFSDIPDAQVDEDGIISNYEEISAAIDKAHNELIDKYNAAAAASNEEETKRLDEQIKKFDDLGEAILKNSQRANDIQVEIEDLTNTLEDLKYNIQDIRNEAYKAAVESYEKLVEIKEEAAELKGLFRDFDDNSFMNAFSIDDTPYQDLIVSLEKINDIYSVSKEKADAYYDDLIQKQEALKESTTDPAIRKAAESTISFYKEQQALLSDTDSLENGELGRNRRELERLKGWIDNPDAEDNPFKDDEATLWELYDQARENTLESFKKYREEVQNYRNAILDIYDDQEDAIDRQINQFDRLTEKVERISDTYSLYYGEDSYDQLDTFYARQGDIMKNQLDQLNTAYNHWQKQYQEALATGDKKLIQEIQDKMDDAEDAMLDAAQELAELWVKKFENAVEASSQHIYNNLFGSNDISELTDNWELQKDYMERYKDDVEKAYEVDKLRNKYLDLLDEAQGSSAQTQNRIRQQMQEQLDLLQNQTTVSEYDVKLANAKLEILQKQIALEDAQRNKNKMQLRRDTQGNYRYIYTADQGNVREAQQDLEDSEYDAYEMTKQETISNNDRAINLLQDYIQKRAAIWNKYKDDATARGQALAELEAEYEKIFGALAEDFTDTSSGMYDVLNWLVKNGSEDTTTAAIGMLDTLYDKNGEIKDKTGQDWMDLANLIQNQVLPKITEAVTKADLELEDQAVSLKDSMVGPGGALTKIGSGADDIANSMDMAAESTRALASATDDLFTALGADDGKLQTALKKLTEYEEQLRKTQETTSSLATQLRTANEIAAAKTAEANNYKTSLDRLRSGEDIIVNHEIVNAAEYKRQQEEAKRAASGGGGGGGGGGRNHLADARAIWYNGAWGNGGDWYTPYSRLYGRDNANKVLWYFNHGYGVNFDFDTGGYTGEWDKTDGVAEHKHGKLAFLHQKELVLNESDTKNILEAVSMIREMSTITQNSLSSIGKTNPVNNISSTYNPLTEQRVDIQASFPNATDAEDIRQALIGLSDQAYQYAHKTI